MSTRSEYLPTDEEAAEAEAAMAGDADQAAKATSPGIGAGIVTAAELSNVIIPERRAILGTFFREGDVGFLFAQRGFGKTLMALQLCKLAILGGSLGAWRAKGGARVLYLDCEMPKKDMEDRLADFGLLGRDDFVLLNHEVLFVKTGLTMNLADPVQQRAVIEEMEQRKCNLMIFDNVSTGLRNVRENASEDWDPVGTWLMDMRRRGIAALVLHHAGRNNEMRGTSKREDPATWVLRLDRDKAADDASEANVVVRFTKYRTGCREDAEPFGLRFLKEPGKIVAQTTRIDSMDLVIDWVRDGLTSASDIAAEMGLTKGTVSKLATKAMDAGRLVKKGRDYAIA